MGEFPYVLFERTTGKIVSICSASVKLGEGRTESVFPHLDMLHVEVPNMDDWYVFEDEVTPRPRLPVRVNQSDLVANGVDELVISGFPDPCEVIVNETAIALTGGKLTLVADTPAVYRIECRHWPHLDWSIDIEAKESRP